MARRLAIHIGAQKCASSSLQTSLRLFQNACKNNSFSFVFLNPAQLRAASNALTHKTKEPFQYIDRILSELKSDFSVISHEMLGNRQELVQAIARRALKRHGFEHIVVVGYTRLQSSYHISAFKQWFFRDRKKLRDDIAVFKDHALPWRKFSALERSLLAMALTGKDRNWHANYKKFSGGSTALSPQVTISLQSSVLICFLKIFSSCLVLIAKMIFQYLMFAEMFLFTLLLFMRFLRISVRSAHV